VCVSRRTEGRKGFTGKGKPLGLMARPGAWYAAAILARRRRRPVRTGSSGGLDPVAAGQPIITQLHDQTTKQSLAKRGKLAQKILVLSWLSMSD
jgi:hypothetical protein